MSSDTGREHFEAWHRREFPHNPLERNGPFGYVSGSVRNRYKGWQAACAEAQRCKTCNAAAEAFLARAGAVEGGR